MIWKKEFTELLVKTKAVKFGDFTLVSGAKSPYYIDLRILPSFPEIYKRITDIMAEYVNVHIHGIEGSERQLPGKNESAD